MTIKKKVDVEAVISKGGEVSADKEEKSSNWKMVCLRVRADLLSSVDQRVGDRVGMNRNAWVLEAIQEKLQRD